MTDADAVVEAFQRDGVVLLEGVFGPWVEGAREAIEQNKANPTWRERTYRPDDGSAPFFQDYCVWARFAGYRALVAGSPMAEIAALLMCSTTARIFHDHILVKEPGNSVVTPWHQDQPYYSSRASRPSASGCRSTPCRGRAPSSTSPARIAGARATGRSASTAPTSTPTVAPRSCPTSTRGATRSTSAAGRWRRAMP